MNTNISVVSNDELEQLRTDSRRFHFLLKLWASKSHLSIDQAIAEIDTMLGAGEGFLAYLDEVERRQALRRRKIPRGPSGRRDHEAI